MARSIRLSALQGRTRDFTLTLYEADGTTGVALAAEDVVRVKIGLRGATPLLDLDSVAATSNGSLVTITSIVAPAVCTLRLAQGDLSSLFPGAYDLEVSVVDDSETAPADAIKSATQGVLHVLPSMGGDVGTT